MNENKELKDTYDARVQNYLETIIDCQIAKLSKPLCGCGRHSHPQFMFLLFDNGGQESLRVDPLLDIVGDIEELQSMSELARFTFNRKPKTKRKAKDNEIKQTYYPKGMKWLSDATLQRICDFVLMDYLAFDFEPPLLCCKQIKLDMMNIIKYGQE